MFGALAVYVGDKIVFLLRDRPSDPQANGVWLAIPPSFRIASTLISRTPDL